MGFQTIREIRQTLEDTDVTLNSTEVRFNDELFVLSLRADGRLSEEEVLQRWNDSWFPNESIGIEETNGEYTMYVGPKDSIPDRCSVVADPTVPVASPSP